MFNPQSTTGEEPVLRSILLMVGTGVVLGLLFNGIGLRSKPAWGLGWIGQDPAAQMVSLDDLQPAGEGGSAVPVSDDPMAIAGGGEGLPHIPALDRPIEARIEQVKLFHDAGAALFVDAREEDEYLEGHIKGALLMPFDVASGDPAMLENLDTGGRPIVVYCGGGACELSMSLAWELIYAGHERVMVYMGGYGEWEEAGYPIQKGGEHAALPGNRAEG